MLSIEFNRESVCMGDDVNAGTYIMEFSKDSKIKDLMQAILHGGNGNTWPVTRVAAWREDWKIRTDAGLLAESHAKFGGNWKIQYKDFGEELLLRDTGIEWTYA